ncbi:Clp protease N-terminal domain-containing protein [Lentzea atacamensis]|nr:Clp protease N-terminal domain-containing protein [Lentzea atacamensis]
MIYTPSSQVVKVLAAAVRRASRLEFGFVGTENLLIALADTTGPGRKLGVKSLRPQAMARGTEHWAGDDGGVLAEPDPGVTALMRAAHHHARVTPVLPVSRALDECLRAAITDAGDGVLTTTHLSLALLSQGSGRVADLFTVRRVDVEAMTEAVRRAAEPEEAPAVWLLRKAGALEGESGGGYVRWLTKLVVRGGGLGGPVLPAVRNEAERLAVAAGRPEATAADLVAAVLTVDHQLTVAGRRLRPEFESGGAAALRAAGVDPAALPAASGAGVERFVEGAKLVAAQRGDDVVGTSHLLVAVREDLLDPVGRVLRDLAVET